MKLHTCDVYRKDIHADELLSNRVVLALLGEKSLRLLEATFTDISGRLNRRLCGVLGEL